MINVYSSSPIISNATFSGNVAAYGGGIANYSASNPVISNSIMWNDIGTSGSEEEIFNPVTGAPCNPIVTYSDIDQVGYDGINGNISNDPLFIGDYYLSHIATGQAFDSPAIDWGNPASLLFGTTRTDGVADSGVLDMGYHHPIP